MHVFVPKYWSQSKHGVLKFELLGDVYDSRGFSIRFLCFHVVFRSSGPRQCGLWRCEVLGDLFDLAGWFNELCFLCLFFVFRSFGPKQHVLWKCEILGDLFDII